MDRPQATPKTWPKHLIDDGNPRTLLHRTGDCRGGPQTTSGGHRREPDRLPILRRDHRAHDAEMPSLSCVSRKEDQRLPRFGLSSERTSHSRKSDNKQWAGCQTLLALKSGGRLPRLPVQSPDQHCRAALLSSGRNWGEGLGGRGGPGAILSCESGYSQFGNSNAELGETDMDRYLSRFLFSANFSGRGSVTEKSYELTTAADADVDEEMLQTAIEKNCELVLAPCRESGLIQEPEQWLFWGRNVSVPEVGFIDVLLLSEYGRIGIVETKLAYNPEKRRAVLVQVLEYALHLPSVDIYALPLPMANGDRPFVDRETVAAKIQEGDYLLIIAGDQLDSRVIRLSQALLGKHLARAWDLALVEVAFFKKKGNKYDDYLLVPHLRGVVIAEPRQVVRVVVDGDQTRVSVGPHTPVRLPGRHKWTEEEFLNAIKVKPDHLRNFYQRLRELREQYPEALQFDYGTAEEGSVVLKRVSPDSSRFYGILEFYLDPHFSFHTEDGIIPALGKRRGTAYINRLKTLFRRDEICFADRLPFSRDRHKAPDPSQGGSGERLGTVKAETREGRTESGSETVGGPC